MRVVLTDGSEFSCRNFKAIDSGVLLTKDKKRKKVVGFVPHHQLRYVVEDDREPTRPEPEETRSVAGSAEASTQRHEDTVAGDTLVAEQPTTAAEPGGERDGETTSDDGTAGASDLQRLGGLGSTYAERLRTAGYETLADLAVADPVTVAEAASVAPGRGRRWVNAAGRAVAADAGGSDPESDDADGADEVDGADELDGDDGGVSTDGDGDTPEGERRDEDDEETGA